MIRVTKLGATPRQPKMPADQKFVGTCRKCGAAVECGGGDVKVSRHGPDEVYYFVWCPDEGCKTLISLEAAGVVDLEREGEPFPPERAARELSELARDFNPKPTLACHPLHDGGLRVELTVAEWGLSASRDFSRKKLREWRHYGGNIAPLWSDVLRQRLRAKPTAA